MQRRSLITGAAAAALAPATRPARAEDSVDVLLVLAVDVSRSVDEEQARLQRDGYTASILDAEVMKAVQGGMLGAIGVAYMEWSGVEDQRLVVPWTRIASPTDAESWVAALNAHSPRPIGWTSVSGALDFSRHLLKEAPWHGMRRVVDVSGDGVNNSGRPSEEARDEAVAEGVIINGLPIMGDRSRHGLMPLDEYYRRNVTGGPGAFVVPATGFDSFGRAVRRKLMLEIAGLPVAGGVAIA